jgi:predicted metal-binding membrane protein
LTADAALAAALRRERLIALGAMLLIAVLAWTWLVREAARMAGMDMPGMADVRMNHLQMMSPAFTAWSRSLALYLFGMWFVMMIGMMVPSAAPMVLLYLGVARHAERGGQRFASAAWFLLGYLLAWGAFSMGATLAHWALESAAMMTPAMRTANRAAGALVLIAAGIYQWLPVKDACLTHCRAPLSFIQQHGGFQPSAGGAMRLGLLHGLYCVGCCWALMLVLFAVGVMNLLWIAALMCVVLAEKLVPRGRWIARIVGAVATASGLAMLLRGGVAT